MPEFTYTTNESGVPTSDFNLQDDDFLRHPFPTFAAMREAGPVIWLESQNVFALPRYAEVSAVLSDWDTFTSAEGVGLNEYFNAVRNTSLHSHGEHHDEIRQVQSCPIKKGPLEELKPRLQDFAERLVAQLRGRPQVDGVQDIAWPMPVEIVTDLVGLQGLEGTWLVDVGVAGFDAVGPLDAPRTGPSFALLEEWDAYAQENFPDKVTPGGWAEQLLRNGAEVGWSTDVTREVLADYIFPSLDTTINSISGGLKLFAENPEQWDRLRADRGLMVSAISEILRLASPLMWFTRLVTTDTEVSGVKIPAGSRVLVMYSSANRDTSAFPDAETFDITRDPALHVGWGRGKHTCLGKPLARLEMSTLFNALADHVSRFHVGAVAYRPNYTIHGLEKLELNIEWDSVPATASTAGAAQ